LSQNLEQDNPKPDIQQQLVATIELSALGIERCKSISSSSLENGLHTILDEAIHQSGVKVGVGTPNCCRILGFQETWETKKRLLLVGCSNLLLTHFLLLIGWLN
jgi:hypothetical protein